MLFTRGLARFKADSEYCYSLVRPSAALLGWCAVVLIPSFYIFDWLAEAGNYDTLVLRLSVGLFAIPLLFVSKLSAKQHDYYKYFYVIQLYVGFVFFWGAALVYNAALANEQTNTNFMYWQVQYMVGLFLLILLCNSLLLAVIGFFVGTLAVMLGLLLFETVNWGLVTENYLMHFAAYLTVVVVGSLANRWREVAKFGSILAARTVAENIAHELSTPLSGISTRARGVSKYLEALVAGYNQAVKDGYSENTIGEKQLDLLKVSLQDIADQSEQSINIVSMLLMNTSEKFATAPDTPCLKASEIVLESVKSFPYANDKERDLLHVEVTNDFEFRSSPELIKHVILNLVKNAVYFVQKSGSGNITIGVGRVGTKTGQIVVEDTGPGIPVENLDKIFQRFFTTSERGTGTGIGLHFCRSAITALGGQITCSSELGKYTRFTIELPFAGS